MQDYFSDNEEMLAKFAAGATGYDIIVPTGNAVETLIAQGVLRELDQSKIKGLENLKPKLRGLFFDPDNRYSIPYAYSITLLGYNKEQLCCQNHTNMIAEVRVVSQSEFDAWLTGEVAKLSDPVAIGQNVYENNCKACHTIDGSKGVGPSWLGLYGREETLTDGTTVVVDEAYIIESIINTNAKIVAGFPAGVMPQNYGEVLTEEQINGVIEYIRTLVP